MRTYIQSLPAQLSVLLFGLMAGFFATYSFNVNYAMQEVNGATYATVQSLFNINVRHFGFFLCFFGAGAIPIFTGVLSLSRNRKQALGWFALGLLYIFGIILFTKFINLPLNYYTESWNPQALPKDWQKVRVQWNNANLFRACFSIGLFVLSIQLLTDKFDSKKEHHTTG